MSMFAKLLAAPALAAALVCVAQAASATTVLAVDDTYPGVAPLNGTLTCAQSCLGLVNESPATWANDGAVLFTVHPPNLDNETDWVNSVTGGSYTGTKTEQGGGHYSFVTDALYILFKIGGGNTNATFLVQNTFGKGLKVTWDEVPGQGAGLSHYTEFGAAPPPPSQVPLPAAGVLLAAALGGIGAVRSRRRT